MIKRNLITFLKSLALVIVCSLLVSVFSISLYQVNAAFKTGEGNSAQVPTAISESTQVPTSSPGPSVSQSPVIPSQPADVNVDSSLVKKTFVSSENPSSNWIPVAIGGVAIIVLGGTVVWRLRRNK